METRETITLDARAQQRVYVLNHVLTGGLTAEEAARVLELSIRQVRRLLGVSEHQRCREIATKSTEANEVSRA